jgi:hypothetical protein
MDRGTDDAAAAGGAARTSVRGEIGVGLGWKERKGMGRGGDSACHVGAQRARRGQGGRCRDRQRRMFLDLSAWMMFSATGRWTSGRARGDRER